MRKLLIALAAALTAFVGFLVSPLSTSLPDTVFLSEMTWLEVEEAMRQGKTGVIVPTAGLEQNGVHAVLGKHRYIVRHTAERIARTLRTALVAPVIDYVPEGDIEPPSGHMRFTGTISISPSLFGQILESTARSLRAHGFERIYFLGDSLGNQKPQAEVAAKLNREWTNETTRVLHIGDYYAKNGQLEWLKAKGETEFSIGGHAGIRDTSELLDPPAWGPPFRCHGCKRRRRQGECQNRSKNDRPQGRSGTAANPGTQRRENPVIRA